MTDLHAHPFRMIDRVLERGEDRCLAVKLVTADEVLQDGRANPGPPYPSSLVIEAMAQAAIPLAAGAAPPGGSPAPSAGPRGVIVAIDGVRVHRQVLPGERLRISAAIVARFGGMIRIAGRAAAEREGAEAGVVAEGEFTVALE
jgi:3-hydroxymyristoyl/3-hydroxydecanoyl-(acyl carrier protein) dehydratase